MIRKNAYIKQRQKYSYPEIEIISSDYTDVIATSTPCENVGCSWRDTCSGYSCSWD